MIRRAFLGLAAALAFSAPALAQEDSFIIVQSTTSTQNSGLFDYLLPIFTDKTGIEVRVVAVEHVDKAARAPAAPLRRALDAR